MKTDKTLKKVLLLYGASEEEANNFLEDLAKMPDEVEDKVEEVVVEKEFNEPQDDREEKDFNDPNELEEKVEKDFN